MKNNPFLKRATEASNDEAMALFYQAKLKDCKDRFVAAERKAKEANATLEETKRELAEVQKKYDAARRKV